MRKFNAIPIAVAGVLVVIFSLTGVRPGSAACGSACHGASTSKVETEKSVGCSGEKLGDAPAKEESSSGFLASYFETRRLLAHDNVKGLSEFSESLARDTEEFRKGVTEHGASSEQLEALREIESAASAMELGEKAGRKVDKLKAARESFRLLSRNVLGYVEEYGWDGIVYGFYCPMAKDSWLQETEEVGNPYYGSEMFECGKMTGRVMKGKYMAVKMETETKEHKHH